MQQPPEKRLAKARTALVLDAPFFGALALRLRLEPDPSIETACTDGARIKYSPAFIEGLNDAQLKGLLAHEVLHCTNGHPWRMEHRDPRKWNTAADLAINPLLIDAGFTLPADGLECPPEWHGLSAEAIYNRLPDGSPDDSGNNGQQSPQDGPQDGQGSTQGRPDMGKPGPGEVEAPAPGTQAAEHAAELEAEWKAATIQAAKAAAAMGKLPGSLARLVDEIKRPRVNWRAELRRFIQQSARNDYAWRKPAARYMHAGLYLPGLQSESMPPLVVCVDTSGSIDPGTLAAFGAEIQAIMDETRPEALHVVYCDSRINKTQAHEPGDLITLESTGGGGTDFRPPFAWVDAEGIQPAALIYLTDLQGPAPAEAPDYPVLWACTDARKSAPFGELLPLED